MRNTLLLATFLALFLTTGLPAASADGIQIHYTATGKGPKTVILIHGYTCDESTWVSQVPALSEKYRVVTLDLPGHGKSGSPEGGKFSMDLFARAVEAVRKETTADRVVVVGHSMGTPVVIQYAREFPQHTVAMVFVDGMISLPKPDGPGFHPPDPNLMVGPEGKKRREEMVRGTFSSFTTPEMQRHILSMMLGGSDSTAFGAMQAMRDPSYWKDDVFNQPVLGLYEGQASSVDPQYMKIHFPNMNYEEIPGTGHFLMLEKPKEFNHLLIAFLDKQTF
jgi:pimeloyl-ACP methyl ester carboxylesterase